MSDAVLITLVIMAGLVGIAWICANALRDLWSDPDTSKGSESDAEVLKLPIPDSPLTKDPAPHLKAVPPPEGVPLPVDPDRPPYPTIYKPRSAASVPPRCYCHGTEVSPGQSVLMWPLPGGEYKVFCQRGER